VSISFSGLASGLDTSSWVQSLVALKQAKVTTLQTEKENVALSKDTLNSIKSFFSSFRSLLERVTDTKFNIVSMDLFAQNIATSANLDIVTATATTEAKEGTYKVKVDQLASNTQAISNHSYLTTIIETTTATADSLLKHLGVNSGDIIVTVGDIEHGVSIEDTDTIATFIEKLKNIGVEASFNENTGVFSMNTSASDINDIGNTNIVDALHLEGVNEGYNTDQLLVSKQETIYTPADEGTLLTELGVILGETDSIIKIEANDTIYEIAVNKETSLGNFINSLKGFNIDAKLEKTGIFTIRDAEIVNEGGTNIISALGFDIDIYSKSQKSKDLSEVIITTDLSDATGATLLEQFGITSDLGEIQRRVELYNSEGSLLASTVLESTSTMQDLVDFATTNGVEATVADGVLIFNDGYINNDIRGAGNNCYSSCIGYICSIFLYCIISNSNCTCYCYSSFQ